MLDHILLYLAVCLSYSSSLVPPSPACNVAAKTESGWVCGVTRWAKEGSIYASFRGVPYAKQPVGELRFKPLQPVEPWSDTLDASTERAVCQQRDVLYGDLMKPHDMSEACIYANIHVPLNALPNAGLILKKPTLPIFVFVHGGGFAFGSGDSDIYGPEYLVSKNVIVITFNYRLNVFGFFTMNTPNLPGNNGLRDIVTLLQWVQRNARSFGGNPEDVTIAGQSAGAAAVHLLTLSKAAEGLFSRAILMSGTGISPFYTASPAFSQFINTNFLQIVGINSTDPDEIYDQLLAMPVEKLNQANSILIDIIGLTTFFPVVETAHPGITTILDEDPSILVKKGRGKNIPLIIGFTSAECYMFQRRLEEIDILSKINANPMLVVPLNILYANSLEYSALAANTIKQRYFNKTMDLGSYINLCTDSYYKYPAIKLAERRALSDGAPVYLYEFSFEGQSVFKYASNLKFTGAGHADDLTYVLKVNSVLGNDSSFRYKTSDYDMQDWMREFVVNFMQCSSPVCEDLSQWCPVESNELQYQAIKEPKSYHLRGLTQEQEEMVAFFDSLNGVGETAES